MWITCSKHRHSIAPHRHSVALYRHSIALCRHSIAVTFLKAFAHAGFRASVTPLPSSTYLLPYRAVDNSLALPRLSYILETINRRNISHLRDVVHVTDMRITSVPHANRVVEK